MHNIACCNLTEQATHTFCPAAARLPSRRPAAMEAQRVRKECEEWKKNIVAMKLIDKNDPDKDPKSKQHDVKISSRWKSINRNFLCRFYGVEASKKVYFQ